jgi:hypothetical protein
MKRILLAALLIISITAQAQHHKKRPVGSTASMYFGMGAAGQSFSQLNSRIAARPELQPLRKTQGMFYLGFAKERKNVLFDFNFGVGSSLSGDAERKSSNISMFTSSINIGYNFSNNKNIRVYPFIGIGGETFMAKFFRDVSAIPFDSVLQNTSWQQRTAPSKFTSNFFTYKLGFAVDFLNKNNPHYAIGLKVGYTGGFKDVSWRVNDNQVLANAPVDRLSGWFASIQFMRNKRVKQR